MINKENIFKEIEMKFKAAIDAVTVERGLSNVTAFKKRYTDAFNQMHQRPYIAFGNKKLPKTTAIYNIGTWFLCPGRLEGYCELSEVCYAKCREVMGSVIQSRLNNYYYWKNNNAETIAEFICYSIKLETLKGNQVNLLRFNEVGEMENQEDLEKMIKISNIIYLKTGIKSYTYTHNRNLNFTLRGNSKTQNQCALRVTRYALSPMVWSGRAHRTVFRWLEPTSSGRAGCSSRRTDGSGYPQSGHL